MFFPSPFFQEHPASWWRWRTCGSSLLWHRLVRLQVCEQNKNIIITTTYSPATCSLYKWLCKRGRLKCTTRSYVVLFPSDFTKFVPHFLTGARVGEPGAAQCTNISRSFDSSQKHWGSTKTTINYVLVYVHYPVPKLIKKEQRLNNVVTYFIAEYVVPPSTVGRFRRLIKCFRRGAKIPGRKWFSWAFLLHSRASLKLNSVHSKKRLLTL